MAYTILIVDDEPSLRSLVRGILEQAGYQVTEAAVHERTRCAVIRYTGPREQLLQALGQFTWAKAAPPRVKYLGGMHCASPVCEAA